MQCFKSCLSDSGCAALQVFFIPSKSDTQCLISYHFEIADVRTVDDCMEWPMVRSDNRLFSIYFDD